MLDLPDGAGSFRLSIVSDPVSIPAEAGRVEPSPIVVPAAYAGGSGLAGNLSYQIQLGERARIRVLYKSPAISTQDYTEGTDEDHHF